MNYYLAIDIGSTSGRHIVGWEENGELQQQEVYRFPNGIDYQNGRFTWNIERLYQEVINGIRYAFQRYPEIRSLSIDTWGTDYVLMNGENEILPCFAYRDPRTEEAALKVHEIIPYHEIYHRTGYQYGAYNTIYQLYSDKLTGRLEYATDFLMMPEYLLYRLSGVKKKEITENSTTSLINPYTGEFDLDLTRILDLPDMLFPKLSSPGTVLGMLKPDVAERVGGNCKVVFCATHDTESAISAITMEQDQIFISSGTWSLLGVRIDEPITSKAGGIAGFSNEVGLEYICYLTNITGMWIAEQLRKELCPGECFDVIVEQARLSGYRELFDPGSPRFATPESMAGAIIEYMKEKNRPLPKSNGDFFSSAYHSLAATYQRAITALENVTGKSYEKIYITGGGAKNSFLNQLTEEYTGKHVIAYPMEASTAGSIKVQMKTDNWE